MGRRGQRGRLGHIPRLLLVPATQAQVAAELESAGRLALLLDAIVPPDWPPEHHDVETLRFWSEQLSRSGAVGWWLHYVMHRTPTPARSSAP